MFTAFGRSQASTGGEPQHHVRRHAWWPLRLAALPLPLALVPTYPNPDGSEHLTALAFASVGDTRSEFAAYIRSEVAKWGKVVKDPGAKSD